MAKILLIHTNGNHNKFWIAENKSHVVTFRWGRIGTNGQSKTESTYSIGAAVGTMEEKARRKYDKGYRRASEAEFTALTLAAQMVGSANKVSDVTFIDGGTKETLQEQDLYDPDRNIVVRTKVRLWHKKEEYLYTIEIGKKVEVFNRCGVLTNVPQEVQDVLDKAQEATGLILNQQISGEEEE